MVLGFLKIYFAVFIDDMERADIMEEEDREMGRKRGKGPVKETADKEEQEEGRMGKGGPVKETMNKGEQKVGSQEGRKGKKSPVKGQASENSKSTPV